jgi:hypothetical protein
LHGHTLDVVDSEKYLGFTINKDLTWTKHINQTIGKASKTLGFSSCSGVLCCVIVGGFNGNQLMVDLVEHYKGLFPSSLLEGFPLKTV